jgi:hypothetical protein
MFLAVVCLGGGRRRNGGVGQERRIMPERQVSTIGAVAWGTIHVNTSTLVNLLCARYQRLQFELPAVRLYLRGLQDQLVAPIYSDLYKSGNKVLKECSAVEPSWGNRYSFPNYLSFQKVNGPKVGDWFFN